MIVNLVSRYFKKLSYHLCDGCRLEYRLLQKKEKSERMSVAPYLNDYFKPPVTYVKERSSFVQAEHIQWNAVIRYRRLDPFGSILSTNEAFLWMRVNMEFVRWKSRRLVPDRLAFRPLAAPSAASSRASRVVQFNQYPAKLTSPNVPANGEFAIEPVSLSSHNLSRPLPRDARTSTHSLRGIYIGDLCLEPLQVSLLRKRRLRGSDLREFSAESVVTVVECLGYHALNNLAISEE